MIRSVVTLFLTGAILGGCGSAAEDVAFDGHFYRTKLSDLDERHAFQVTASPVSASLTGAREAARYEATIYCVTEFGSSDIDWDVGPDHPDADLPIAQDTLTLQGACPL